MQTTFLTISPLDQLKLSYTGSQEVHIAILHCPLTNTLIQCVQGISSAYCAAKHLPRAGVG